MRSQKALRASRLAYSALLPVVLVSASLADASAPSLPLYRYQMKIVWLDQGWTEAQRSWYHHVSQGTDTIPIPYKWFVSLERPEASLHSPGLLTDPEYLDRFGFIPSPKSADNPDGLPVGFARTTAVDPKTGKSFDHAGFTCAACHTGRLDYMGTRILIDGGPAMTDVGKFRKALAFSLALTKLDLPRFKRFADRVLGPGHSVGQGLALKLELDRTVLNGLVMTLGAPSSKGSIEEGFGRLDALNAIGNEVFGNQMGQKANYAPLTAPVAYPHIWDTAWFDWVQYNSSIQQPMVRNAGEAMGVQALVNYQTSPTRRFTSTVPIDRLHAIEQRLAGNEQPSTGQRFTGLRAPAWPENILPPINRALAAEGAQLYDKLCSGCHLPALSTQAFWNSQAWLPPNKDGMRFLRPTVIPVSVIGTDEAQAVDMKKRTVRVPLAFNFKGAVGTVGTDGIYPYGPALGQVVERVVTRWYDDQTPPISPDARNRMNGFRPNGIRDGIAGPNGVEAAYKARPLDGIWATAPFLHNGSIATLYDLLSPMSERPKIIWLGNREFDPVKVGYASGPITGGFKLDTVDQTTGRRIRGNSNAGHLFETPANPAQPRPGTIGPGLSRHERSALVEYLKTL